MSRFDHTQSRAAEVDGYTFKALIMAAMRKADPLNARLLGDVFPDIASELRARDAHPRGYLPAEDQWPNHNVVLDGN